MNEKEQTFGNLIREKIERDFLEVAEEAGKFFDEPPVLEIFKAQTYMLNAWDRYVIEERGDTK